MKLKFYVFSALMAAFILVLVLSLWGRPHSIVAGEGDGMLLSSEMNAEAALQDPETLAADTSHKKVKDLDRATDMTDDTIDVAEYVNSLIVADLCDDHEIEKFITVKGMIEHAKKKGNIAEATHAELEVSRLCGSTRTKIFDSPRQDPTDYVYQESEPLKNAVAFVAIVAEDILKKKSVDEWEVQLFVRNKIAESSNLYELTELVSLFSEHGILYTALSEYGYPNNIEERVVGVAAIVAACRIFGGCEPNSEFSISMCFLRCTTSLGASENALSSLAQHEQKLSLSAANAIVQARSR